jgi:hypothetical protein
MLVSGAKHKTRAITTPTFTTAAFEIRLHAGSSFPEKLRQLVDKTPRKRAQTSALFEGL